MGVARERPDKAQPRQPADRLPREDADPRKYGSSSGVGGAGTEGAEQHKEEET